MQKFLISRIEATLLYLDKLDKKRPRLKRFTVYPALAIVLLREKIDPYQPEIEIPRKKEEQYSEQIGPVELMETPDGGYGLIYYGYGEASDHIIEAGGQGGGYSWESLVKAVLEINAVKASSLTFDPEADMFAVYATDVGVLRIIAKMIIDLNENRELLNQAIEHAKETGSFE